MSNILGEILAHKETEIRALDTAALRRAAESAPMPRDFAAAVRRREGFGPKLIAELKLASPSKGLLAPELDLMRVAKVYAEHGAAAISVLTDERFFLGKLESLYALRFTEKSRCLCCERISLSTRRRSTNRERMGRTRSC